MQRHLVSVPLNQQQLELIDRTVARGLAADRSALLRRAIEETLQAARAEEASAAATTAGATTAASGPELPR